jgi:type II restriction enzyme
MKLAILKDRAPHLFLLHYDLNNWSVKTLILIPRFVFSLAAIERKKPLAPTAKRAGWVGCYILVEALAKISIIADGKTIAPDVVRQHFGRVRPLERIETAQREWALDVLAVVRSLNKKVFSLKEAYSFESRLAHLHPENHHIREKIRQQLQVLRDHGFIEFLGHGEYRLR